MFRFLRRLLGFERDDLIDTLIKRPTPIKGAEKPAWDKIKKSDGSAAKADLVWAKFAHKERD